MYCSFTAFFFEQSDISCVMSSIKTWFICADARSHLYYQLQVLCASHSNTLNSSSVAHEMRQQKGRTQANPVVPFRCTIYDEFNVETPTCPTFKSRRYVKLLHCNTTMWVTSCAGVNYVYFGYQWGTIYLCFIVHGILGNREEQVLLQQQL